MQLDIESQKNLPAKLSNFDISVRPKDNLPYDAPMRKQNTAKLHIGDIC